MRKIQKLLFLISLIIQLTSCYSSRIPVEVIKTIEHEDDNLCMMQGVEFEYNNTRKIYWQCRLRIINQRISGEFDNYGYSLLYKKEFKRLRRIIKNRIKNEEEKIIAEIDGCIDEKEHNYCIILKKQFLKENNIDYNYFSCREDLKKARDGKNDFSNLDNEYIMKILEYHDEIKKENSKNIYTVQNECIKYVGNAEKLKKCQIALEKIKGCYSNIDEKMFQRRIDDKIYCEKLSQKKYPDSLSKFEETKQDTLNMLGPKMNKIDIISLREKTFNECFKDRTLKIIKFHDYLLDQCKISNLKIIEGK